MPRWYQENGTASLLRRKSRDHSLWLMRSLRSKAQAGQAAHWLMRNNRKFGKTLLAMAVFWPLCLPAQWLPTIKAVVGQPVLQELMGGCSMRCAFPWTTSALFSGKSPQIVYTLDDNDASTAWIDPNPAIGTKLQFQFPAASRSPRLTLKAFSGPITSVSMARSNRAGSGGLAGLNQLGIFRLRRAPH
jgi:hypothetical protein